MTQQKKFLMEMIELRELSEKLYFVIEMLNRDFSLECVKDGERKCEEISRNATFAEIADKYSEILCGKLKKLECNAKNIFAARP